MRPMRLEVEVLLTASEECPFSSSACDYKERDGRSAASTIDASLAEGLMSTGIEFRESPQKSDISSIAVIPRRGIDCEGQQFLRRE